MKRAKPKRASTYFEENPKYGLEYHMVELTTVREFLVEKLSHLVTDIRDKNICVNDSCLINVFKYYNEIRNVTMDLIHQIFLWQKGFKKIQRPYLNKSDYLVNMIGSLDFLCSSPINRYFKFQIDHGNIFLLPVPFGQNNRHYTVSQALSNELSKYMNPPKEKLIISYQVLCSCLPKKSIKLLFQLDMWLMNEWKIIFDINNNNLIQDIMKNDSNKNEENRIYTNTIKQLNIAKSNNRYFYHL